MKKIFTLCGLLFLMGLLNFADAQTQKIRKHFIYFKDKANTPFSVSQPQAFLSAASLARRNRQHLPVRGHDLPVTPAYVTAVKSTGATVLYKSKWFNGVLVSCDSVHLALIQALPFVKYAVTTNRIQASSQPDKLEKALPVNQRNTASRQNYGTAYRQAEQIGATQMHDDGFHGEGMTIAIFDAGFPGVNTAAPFSHLFQNKQIKGVYDFVDNDPFIYEKSSHGTATLSTIGAYQPGTFIGTAYKANFYLFITENEASEHNVEEYNWLAAAEYADSAGVDIISSSLGYNIFDYPSVSYSYSDLNGHTATITKAANYASSVGILVLNSAGNDGALSWHYISAPADADSVLTVGAVDSMGVKAGFSSFGPNSAGRIKPNLVSQGVRAAVVQTNGIPNPSNGTSFSCPIMAGLAAGFWQSNPQLTNMQVIDYLQRSATLANNPNNSVGYGIPNFRTAYNLVAKDNGLVNTLTLYPNPAGSSTINLGFESVLYSGPVDIKIYDRIGRLVDAIELQREVGKKLEFTMKPEVKAGLYFVRISWQNNTRTLPLFKLP